MTLSQNLLALTTAAQESQPYKFNLADKNRPGVCVEIIRALENNNPKLKFNGINNAIPLKRIEEMLVQGKLDVFFGIIKNAERAKAINFPKNGNIFELNSRIAVGLDEIESPRDFNDLLKISKTSPILVSMDAAFANILKSKGIVIDEGSKDDSINLKKILEKRGRFFFTGETNLVNNLKKPEFKNKIKILETIFTKEEMYIAFSKRVSKDQVKMVTDGIKKLRDTKIIEEILKKY